MTPSHNQRKDDMEPNEEFEGSWDKYQRMVLSELRRLSISNEKLGETVGKVSSEVAVLVNTAKQVNLQWQAIAELRAGQATHNGRMSVIGGLAGVLGGVLIAIISNYLKGK